MELASCIHSYAVRAVRGSPARGRLGRVPGGAAQDGKAFAVGPGPDGDPRKRTGSSARTSGRRPHSRRDARREGRAVGDGGGGKMLLPSGRDRRDLGRPQSARLRRDAAAGGRGGTQRHAVLAGAAWRHGEPQRRQDALADWIRAVASERSRPASAGRIGMERRAVPRAWASAGTVESRA